MTKNNNGSNKIGGQQAPQTQVSVIAINKTDNKDFKPIIKKNKYGENPLDEKVSKLIVESKLSTKSSTNGVKAFKDNTKINNQVATSEKKPEKAPSNSNSIITSPISNSKYVEKTSIFNKLESQTFNEEIQILSDDSLTN